jgi:hypothetical protein
MFCRAFLVTNSSTCSAVYFGYRLDKPTFCKLLFGLLQQHEGDVKVERYSRDSPVLNSSRTLEQIGDILLESDAEYEIEEWSGCLFPEGIYVAYHEGAYYVVGAGGSCSDDGFDMDIPLTKQHIDRLVEFAETHDLPQKEPHLMAFIYGC